MKNQRKQLRQVAENLLYGEEDFRKIVSGTTTFYELASDITGIYIDHLTFEKFKSTSNGEVVSVNHAAHCVLDHLRTTRFLQGVHAAIDERLKTGSKVRLLYAGCGPYATLLTPITAIYQPEQLQITLLDIEQTSLQAAKKLYDHLELGSFISAYRLEDATDPDIRFNEKFDIIVSETMQAGLKRECQVAITRNLTRFLKKSGKFIPERIKLEVYLEGKKDPANPRIAERIYMGPAYDLDFRNVPCFNHFTIMDMPVSDYEYLELHTEIYLYNTIMLGMYDCGLNSRIRLARYVEGQNKPRQLKFTYQDGPEPDLVMENVW